VGGITSYGTNFVAYDTTNPLSPSELGRCNTGSFLGNPNGMIYTGFAVQLFNNGGTTDIITSDLSHPTPQTTSSVPGINDVWTPNANYFGVMVGEIMNFITFSPLYYNTEVNSIQRITLRDRDIFLANQQGIGQVTGMDYFNPPVLVPFATASPESSLSHTHVAVRGERLYSIGAEGLSRYHAPVDTVPGHAAVFAAQGPELAAKAITLNLDANGDGLVNSDDTNFNNWDLDRDGVPDAWQLALLAELLTRQHPETMGSIVAYLTNWSAVADDGPAFECQEYTTLIAGLLTLNENIASRLNTANILGNNTVNYAPWRIGGVAALDADYDLDGDGYSNGEEAHACMMAGGNAQQFALNALNFRIPGGPMPAAGGFALAALAAAIALAARKKR
jgi:hypothetical protein